MEGPGGQPGVQGLEENVVVRLRKAQKLRKAPSAQRNDKPGSPTETAETALFDRAAAEKKLDRRAQERENRD